MDTQLPPPMVIYQLASAHYVSQALHVAAHLGIADLLAEGPQTHETLAAKTGTHAGSLRRVLRLLASAGVFAEDADGRFELTPVGSALRSGPGSSRAAARLFAGPMVWRCWGDLLTTVRTGEPAFPRIFRTDSFEYFANHPEEATVFDEAMGSFTAMIAGMVAAAYDFAGMCEVIDVGGGDGRLLTGTSGLIRACAERCSICRGWPRAPCGRSPKLVSPIAIGSSPATSSRRSPRVSTHIC
jgi:hypothetical protein